MLYPQAVKQSSIVILCREASVPHFQINTSSENLINDFGCKGTTFSDIGKL